MLWLPLAIPEGVEVTVVEHEDLFLEIDDLCLALNLEPLDRTLLTETFELKLIRRYHWFGSRNQLLIGLPLLQSLTPYEFRALLAQELSQAISDTIFYESWIWRVRRYWNEVLPTLKAQAAPRFHVMLRFLEWYVPFLERFAQETLRRHEIKSTARAERFVGSRALADAMMRAAISHSYLEDRYWPSVYARAEYLDEPMVQPYLSLGVTLHNGLHPREAKHWLAVHLVSRRGASATLQERLSALREPARLPAQVSMTAAQIFLGDGEERVALSLDTVWKARIAPFWRRLRRSPSSQS